MRHLLPHVTSVRSSAWKKIFHGDDFYSALYLSNVDESDAALLLTHSFQQQRGRADLHGLSHGLSAIDFLDPIFLVFNVSHFHDGAQKHVPFMRRRGAQIRNDDLAVVPCGL